MGQLAFAILVLLVMCVSYSEIAKGGNDGGKAPMAQLDTSTSIAGIDANSNGIRDDIEKVIASYGFTDPQSNAAKQFARAVQAAITKSPTKDAAVKNAQEMQRSLQCMASRIPKKYTTYSDEIQAKTLNTKDRTAAWIAFEGKVGGEVFSEPEGDDCRQ